ncbi:MULTISPECIES: conjugal transfer protein TraE [Vibrio harveyi group]|uniref:VirB4 family type IV secretion/conjugal transfer ATPase n=1 Tax=Vibrio harveyi group TaxID=717610 RepID=UPI0009E1D112|nr:MULTISPECIES: conjugal transfer protein TraE [Vibrio harveyi group]ARR10594.1 conjugal transfer protein TraE [Vibrio campbellii]WHP52922.1 conjugal transfer protein TraE [Vibrio parahaemolyticus]
MNSLNSLSSDTIVPPYARPVTDRIVSLDGEQILATIKVSGILFETANERILENFFQSEKTLFTSLAQKHHSKLAVWTHTVKRKDNLETTYHYKDTFMNAFAKKYVEQFAHSTFYVTDYYITFVLKHSSLKEGISEMNDIISMSLSVLKEFKANALGLIQNENGVCFCENISFLSYLINNHFVDIPLSSDRIDGYVSKSDLHFGYDTLEIRNHESDDSRFAVLYELDTYPNTSTNGMWDFALGLQQEFIISQSIIFMSNPKAIKMIDDQVNVIESANGASTDLAELQAGREALTQGDIMFGDYHASMIVFGDSVSSALDNGTVISSEFLARGTTWKRSNLKSPFTFQSMLPASKVRPLSSPRTVTNFVSGLSLHNFSTGKKDGNPIGDGSAVIPLKTVSDSLFYFNSHASDHGKNVTGQKFAGHTLILGASGAGKTTLEGTLVGFYTRFDPAIFAIDYNRSTELFIRAFDGQYFTLEDGVSSGLNPFQLEDTPLLRNFLYKLVERCGTGDKPLSAIDEKIVKDAVDTVMSLDHQNRRFSTLIQSVPQGSDLRLRLSKWCSSENGSLAWALDAPVNKFDPKKFKRIGFDTTSILKMESGKFHPACEPVLAVLFFIKDLMQQSGQLLMTIVEEFWVPANFPITQELMKSVLKAGRLKNEFMFLTSQSPEDAINCPIFAAIVQQTPTKILLPNPAGEYDSYRKLGLSDKEVLGVLKLGKESRTFLVKQSNDSAFAKLDLYGFDEFLPIISGTTDDIKLCEAIRELINSDDPEKWIPLFQQVKRHKHEVQEMKSLYGASFKEWLPHFFRLEICE